MFAAVLATLCVAWGGGDPRQVLVITNADDPSAAAIADHYAQARTLPPQHVCALSGLPTDSATLPFADYDALVAPAIDACLAGLAEPNDIHILVTTRGLPYRVELEAGYMVGFESLLQIHRAVSNIDGSSLAGSPQTDQGGYFAASVYNPSYVGALASTEGCDFSESSEYARWYSAACRLLRTGHYPASFDRFHDWDDTAWNLSGHFFIVTRLDGFDASDAMDLVDRAVAADSTFPSAPLMCMHGADAARGARDPECEMVARYLSGAGLAAEWIDSFDGGLSGREVAGYLTGASAMTGAIDENTFVPGAIIDNLTSYGAVPQNFLCDASGEQCPENESQTSVARFVRAGATGAHGTVAEPLNNCFPNAALYLLYSAGYSLGESYLFSQRFLYWQNLTLGDPLATPYASRPIVEDGEAAVSAGGTWTITAHHPDGIAWIGAYLEDRLVAEASGATLSVASTSLGIEGDAVDLYIVAEAGSAARSRPGWPIDPILPTPGTRGWRWLRVSVTPPDEVAVDTGTSAETDTAHAETADHQTNTHTADDRSRSKTDAGGCSSAPGPVHTLSWMAALLAVGRRRRC